MAADFPFRTSGSSGDRTTAAGSALTSLTLNKPTNLADGEMLVAQIESNVGTGGDFTSPSGWTRIVTDTTRRGGWWYLVVGTSAGSAAALPSSWSWGTIGSGRIAGQILRVTGAPNPTAIDTNATAETTGSAGAMTYPSQSPTGTTDLAVYGYFDHPGTAQSTSETWGNGVTSLGAQVSTLLGSAVANTLIGIGYKFLSASGAIGTTSLSTPVTSGTGTATPAGALFTILSGASNVSSSVAMAGVGGLAVGGSQQIPSALTMAGVGTLAVVPGGGASASVAMAGVGALAVGGSQKIQPAVAMAGTGTMQINPATTPLQWWLTGSPGVPNYLVHHGGEASFPPENTSQAFASSHAWNPTAMLECPVVQCSTGEYVLSETATTIDFTTVLTISSSTWTALSALRTTVGSHPMMRLKEDFLDVYGLNPNCPLMVDNKLQQNNATLLALLANYGGPSQIMAKSYFTSTSWLTAATSAGYLTWAYYFDTDSASFASTFAAFTYIGLNYGASQSIVTTFLNLGRPAFAHILQNSSARTTADAKAVIAGVPWAGYMISDVIDLIPHTGGTPGTLNMDGSAATLAVGGSQQLPTGVAMAGAGGLSLTPAVNRTAAVTMAGTGTLSVAGSKSGSSAVAMAGVGTLAVGGVAGTPIPMAGVGTLTVGGSQQDSSAIVMAGVGTLAVNPGGASASITMTGGGTLTVAAQPVHPVSLQMAGVSTLTINGINEPTVPAVTMAGLGVVSLTGQQKLPTALGMAGVGTLSVGPGGSQSGSITMFSVATMQLGGSVTPAGAIVMTGGGHLSVGATQPHPAALVLAGHGTLAVGGSAGFIPFWSYWGGEVVHVLNRKGIWDGHTIIPG